MGSKEKAKPLTAQAIQSANQLEDAALKAKVVELIETVLIYKFTELSKEEIQSMFSLSDLKETRVYQQGKEEGKLESVPSLLAVGLSVEQIARALKLDVALVQQVADKSASNPES